MLNRLKIGHRLLLLVAVLAALLIGVAVLGERGQRHASASLRAMYNDRVVASRHLILTLDQALRMRGNIERAGHLLPGEARSALLAAIPSERDDLHRHWQAFLATGMQEAEQVLALRTDAALARLEEASQPVIDALQAGQPWLAKEQRWLAASEAFRLSLEQLVAVQEKIAFETYQQDLSRSGHLRDVQVALILLSMLVGMRMSWLIVRSITRPMDEAIAAARRIADGDLCAVLPEGGRDETGLLLHELKRMKQTLRRMAQDNQDNLERMVTMTDAVPAAVFQFMVTPGQAPRYRFISGQVRDLLGVTAEELLADPVSGWRNVAPDRAEDLRASLRAQMGSDQGDVIDLRAPIVGAAGPRWIRLHARAVRSCEGGQIAWNGYYEDVTAQLAAEQAMRQAKEEAEAAARAKADFLANMSHEIRTPMTAILGMSHLAMQTGVTPRQREYIDKIQRAGRHLLGIINDVLDYSKIEAGKMSAECVDFDLEAILDNVASLAGGIAAASQLELVFDLPADVPTQLRGDPLRLEQVLINLAGNAIKFTGQGEVAVSVRVLERADTGALLRFEVRDTGIGMSAEECGRLFRSFQQADSSTTRKFGGTGLGLAISRRLVELMNGTLGVESTPGAGSSFWFTVPLGVACERTPWPVAHLAGARALVVDDNASARAVLHARLGELGLEAAQAASGEQALGMLQAGAGEGAPFQFVFIDWELARMDGRRVLGALHRQPTGGPVPVTIPVAAFVCESTHREVEGLGLPGVLSKPIMPSPLFAALTRGAGAPLRQQVQARPGAPGGGEHGVEGASVLLVEDNEVIRLVVCELLADLGLDVDTAVNGEIALAKVAAARYDLVLMDMQMPVMNGPDAAREIRRRHGAGLPIVAMTANVMEADRQRCMDAGMNDFVGKPVEPDELRAALLRWIGPRRKTGGAVARARTGGGQGAPALSIDGVDTTAGLRRVNGKLPSYWRQLRTFLGDQGDASARLRAALAEADHVRAAALLHTLRGVAGNIGALALPPLALQLERALRKGAGAALPQLCAQFDEELARLLAALRAAIPADQEAASAAVAPVLPVLPERVCDTLAALINDNNADAETLYREQQASFDAAFGHAGAAIGAALERFDFPLAAELLHGARQRRAAALVPADLPIQPEQT